MLRSFFPVAGPSVPVSGERFPTELYAAAFIKPQHASSVIRLLDSASPLPPHLKRVKKAPEDGNLIVLLGPAGTRAECAFPIEGSCLLAVPSCPPSSKQAWSQMNAIWPVTFHVHKPQFPSWTDFGVEYQNFVLSHMDRLLLLDCRSDSCSEGCLGGASALLFDPEALQIIAEVSPPEKPSSFVVDHASFRLAGLLGDKLVSRTMPGSPYLATGLDVIITHEPCVMCSMAILHSRARHVFFAYSNPRKGGLFSLANIHLHPSLNHHFGVYRYSF